MNRDQAIGNLDQPTERAVGTESAIQAIDWYGLFALGALIAAQVFAIVTSPPERDMGHLQKILYVHVPIAQNMFVAFLVVAIASLLYLWKGKEHFDLLAASAAEVGFLFTGLTLMLGSIWGRPTWGVWWAWDPRLTTTAVLFVVFAGYFALRGFVDDRDRRAQWCAAVGIIGALNVPIVYMSVRWWRTLHQIQSSPSTVDAVYVTGLRLNDIAILLVMSYLIAKRYQTAKLAFHAELLQERIALGTKP